MAQKQPYILTEEEKKIVKALRDAEKRKRLLALKEK